MMKKLLFALVLAMAVSICACAQAAPELSGVFPDDISLVSGQDGWYFQFNASQGGTLAMQLFSGETGEYITEVGAVPVEQGAGRVDWNGLLPDGTAAQPGSYMIAVSLQNFWGEVSERNVFSLQILAEDQEMETMLTSAEQETEAAQGWEEAQQTVAAETGVPQATSFWDMNPDDYDLTNPEHQQAIWDIMMQPITVIQGDQT